MTEFLYQNWFWIALWWAIWFYIFLTWYDDQITFGHKQKPEKLALVFTFMIAGFLPIFVLIYAIKAARKR